MQNSALTVIVAASKVATKLKQKRESKLPKGMLNIQVFQGGHVKPNSVLPQSTLSGYSNILKFQDPTHLRSTWRRSQSLNFEVCVVYAQPYVISLKSTFCTKYVFNFHKNWVDCVFLGALSNASAVKIRTNIFYESSYKTRNFA